MTTIFALLLLLLSTPAGAQPRTNSQYCYGLFPESYSMRESCERREYEAYQRLDRRRLTVDAAIWRYCVGLFPETWTLMESCVKREEEAKERLRWGR